MQLWAALFDWDGVIIDSSRQHEAAWNVLARAEGRPVPVGFFPKSFGMKNDKVIPELLQWSNQPTEIERLALAKEETYRRIVLAEGVDVLPGATALLKSLRVAGVPCAIGSSAPRANIECVIDRIGVREYFQAVVAGEDVRLGKPNPEVFLLAAKKLGWSPARCVVFEDAHVGVAAALAAGMKVVAVATTHAADSLADAHRVVNRLTDITVAEIGALW